MASIDKRPNGKWRARWREYPGAPQHARHFDRKIDAERFLVEVQHKIARGDYTNPSEGLVTLEQFSTEYLARRTWRPATRERVDVSLRSYVLPTFGPWPLNRIRPSHIEEWAAGLKLAPSSVGAVALVLSGLLEAAVKDGRISRNPARGAVLPKIERAPLVPLTVSEVHLLAEAMPAHLQAAVVVGATTGLRQGELAGLTVDRLHLLERTMRIDQQLWTPRNAPPELVAPKGQRSYRTVALAPTTVDVLAAHLAQHGTGQLSLVFHDLNGAPISRDRMGAAMRAAVTKAGLSGITWHDLRHHHASMLLSSGISPALVAERLGHDVGTLMRTYAHVIRNDDDRVRQIVEDSLRTEGLAPSRAWPQKSS